jgi:hypothetical protein
MTMPPWAPALDLSPLTASWSAPRRPSFDAAVSLRWTQVSVAFDVLYCDLATPRRLAGSLARAANWPDPVLVVSKYLSPDAFAALQDGGWSGVDQSGNCHIEATDRLLLHRMGFPNRFPSSTGVRNPFAGRTGLVALALMHAPVAIRPGGLQRLASHVVPISAATVSKALNALEEDALIARGPEGVTVISRDRLLDALAQQYTPPVIERRLRARIRFDTHRQHQLAANAARHGVHWAVETTMPWVAYPGADVLTHIWTTSILDLLDGIPHDEDHPFADVLLTETSTVELFHGLDERMGHPCLSPLMLYLLLTRRDQRAREAAAALRPIILGSGSS